MDLVVKEVLGVTSHLLSRMPSTYVAIAYDKYNPERLFIVVGKTREKLSLNSLAKMEGREVELPVALFPLDDITTGALVSVYRGLMEESKLNDYVTAYRPPYATWNQTHYDVIVFNIKDNGNIIDIPVKTETFVKYVNYKFSQEIRFAERLLNSLGVAPNNRNHVSNHQVDYRTK